MIAPVLSAFDEKQRLREQERGKKKAKKANPEKQERATRDVKGPSYHDPLAFSPSSNTHPLQSPRHTRASQSTSSLNSPRSPSKPIHPHAVQNTLPELPQSVPLQLGTFWPNASSGSVHSNVPGGRRTRTYSSEAAGGRRSFFDTLTAVLSSTAPSGHSRPTPHSAVGLFPQHQHQHHPARSRADSFDPTQQQPMFAGILPSSSPIVVHRAAVRTSPIEVDLVTGSVVRDPPPRYEAG